MESEPPVGHFLGCTWYCIRALIEMRFLSLRLDFCILQKKQKPRVPRILVNPESYPKGDDTVFQLLVEYHFSFVEFHGGNHIQYDVFNDIG